MALIIKGDMPKACWNMKNIDGKIIRYNCPYCGCCNHVFPYDVDYRPSDCPIIGEIPYELENFIIAMSQLPHEKPKTELEEKEARAYEELERRMKMEKHHD